MGRCALRMFPDSFFVEMALRRVWKSQQHKDMNNGQEYGQDPLFPQTSFSISAKLLIP